MNGNFHSVSLIIIYEAKEKGKNKITLIHSPHLSIPQCSQKHGDNYDELKNFNFIKQSSTILEVFESSLQVTGYFCQLLHSTNTLHENAILCR